jgi:hypothetical protein
MDSNDSVSDVPLCGGIGELLTVSTHNASTLVVQVAF